MRDEVLDPCRHGGWRTADPRIHRGIGRIVWMPTMLKEEIKDAFAKRAEEAGLGGEDFLAKIADETTATTEEEVLEFITKSQHPAMAMEPIS